MKQFSKTVSVFLAGILLAAVSGCVNRVEKPVVYSQRASVNLLPNSSFEDGWYDIHNVPEGWEYDPPDPGQCRYEWSQADAHTGSRSVLLGDMFLGGKVQFHCKQVIPIDPVNKTYVLSLWYKCSQDMPPYAASIVLRILKNDEFRQNTWEYLDKHTSWTKFEMICNDIPNVKNEGSSYIADGIQVAMQLVRSEGWVAIDDLDLHVADAAEIDRLRQAKNIPLPDVQTTPTPPVGTTGNYYSVQKVDGAWWMVKPNSGKCTLFMGTSCNRPYSNTNWPHYQFVDSHYSGGGDGTAYKNWQWHAARELLGFNALSAYGGSQRFDYKMSSYTPDHMATATIIDTQQSGDYLKDRYNVIADNSDPACSHPFRDPFASNWRSNAVSRISGSVNYNRNTWYLGMYFMDNEMYQIDVYQFVYSSACVTELVNFMRNRFNDDISALNSAWNVNYSDFSDIETEKPVPWTKTDPKLADFYAFERHLFATYADFTLDEYRSRESNHPIATNRFFLPRFNDILRVVDVFSRYDIFDLHCYGTMTSNGISLSELELYRLSHEATGIPVFMSEWDITGRDKRESEDLYSFTDNCFVDTQADRGEAYVTAVKQMAYTPYHLGHHLFEWGNWRWDEPVWYKNIGIVNDNEQLYTEMTDRMAEINPEILSIDPAFRTFDFTVTDTPDPPHTNIGDLVLCQSSGSMQGEPLQCGVQPTIFVGLLIFGVLRHRRKRR